jgi:hypothetical protein
MIRFLFFVYRGFSFRGGESWWMKWKFEVDDLCTHFFLCIFGGMREGVGGDGDVLGTGGEKRGGSK